MVSRYWLPLLPLLRGSEMVAPSANDDCANERVMLWSWLPYLHMVKRRREGGRGGRGGLGEGMLRSLFPGHAQNDRFLLPVLRYNRVLRRCLNDSLAKDRSKEVHAGKKTKEREKSGEGRKRN